MAKGVGHYKKDGTPHKGKMHKMASGAMHTGATHTDSSVRLFHFKDLTKAAQTKARKMRSPAKKRR